MNSRPNADKISTEMPLESVEDRKQMAERIARMQKTHVYGAVFELPVATDFLAITNAWAVFRTTNPYMLKHHGASVIESVVGDQELTGQIHDQIEEVLSEFVIRSKDYPHMLQIVVDNGSSWYIHKEPQGHFYVGDMSENILDSHAEDLAELRQEINASPVLALGFAFIYKLD